MTTTTTTTIFLGCDSIEINLVDDIILERFPTVNKLYPALCSVVEKIDVFVAILGQNLG